MTRPPMPVLAPGEALLCRECWEPIDPVVWPRHPVHDIAPEDLAASDRRDETAAALAEAKGEAQVRAATRTRSRKRRSRR